MVRCLDPDTKRTTDGTFPPMNNGIPKWTTPTAVGVTPLDPADVEPEEALWECQRRVKQTWFVLNVILALPTNFWRLPYWRHT